MRLFFLTPTIGMKRNVKNNQTNEFIYSTSGGTSKYNADLSIEVDQRIRNA